MTLFEKVYDNTISYLNVWKFPYPEQLERMLQGVTTILVPTQHAMIERFEKHVMFVPNYDTDIEGLYGFFNGIPVITGRNRTRSHNVMFTHSLNRLAQEAIKDFT